jgi:hypothetical protein
VVQTARTVALMTSPVDVERDRPRSPSDARIDTGAEEWRAPLGGRGAEHGRVRGRRSRASGRRGRAGPREGFPPTMGKVVTDAARTRFPLRRKACGMHGRIEAPRATLRYLPLYSSDVNPIEIMGSEGRAALRTLVACSRRSAPRRDRGRAVAASDCVGFHRHCG